MRKTNDPLDRWHQQYPKPGSQRCRCGKETYPSKEHGRGNRWLAPYTDPSGKIKKPSFAEYDVAVNFLAEVSTDMRRGAYVDPQAGKELVRELAKEWFAHLDRVHERVGTVSCYKTHMRAHVLPFFGHFPARTLRRPDSNAFVAALISKGLSAAYIEGVFKTYRIFVHWLMDDQDIPLRGNVVARIKLPPVPPRVEVVLTPEEVERLADCIEPRFEIMVWLAACAGLRLGECAGLTKARVNFLEFKIYVEKQRQAGREVALKTSSSFATIPADPFLIRCMSQHILRFPGPAPVMDETARKRRARGYVPPPDEGLIVVNETGLPLRRQAFNKVWHKAVVDAGLPEGTRFHDLKHFYTSRLHAAGHDRKTVQALSRHGDERTNAIYSHPPEAVEGLKIRAFGALFDPKQKDNRTRRVAG